MLFDGLGISWSMTLWIEHGIYVHYVKWIGLLCALCECGYFKELCYVALVNYPCLVNLWIYVTA